MDDRLSTALERLAAPLYGVAVLLVVTPIFDLTLNVWPLNFGAVEWRYGSIGLLSGFLLTPLIGTALAAWMALGLGHRRTQWTVVVLNLAFAVFVVVACLDFALDVLQLRRSVPATQPGALWTVTVGGAKALLKLGSGALAFAWLALAGYRAARSASPERAPAANTMLVRPSTGTVRKS
jgi:hypothetical protein